MLQKLQIILGSIFWMGFALYLGYGFSDVFFWFIPRSWMAPCVLLCGAGFYLVLRWLKAEDIPQKAKLKTEVVAQKASTPQSFILQESLSTFSHLLQARVFSELVELLTTSRPHKVSQREQIEGIIARATPRLEGCAGPKKCCSTKGKLS